MLMNNSILMYIEEKIALRLFCEKKQLQKREVCLSSYSILSFQNS